MSIDRLGFKNFPEGRNLTKDDYVIIAGDFGLIWDNTQSNSEKYWLDWLNDKPFTTLFVDGNHENHNRLDLMPIEEWKGGNVHHINKSVIHLMRGQIFQLGEKKVFTFGGATSIDRLHRKVDISWWEREMPSHKEYEDGLNNLYDNFNTVDYIITHTAPQTLLYRIVHGIVYHDSLQEYLKTIQKITEYKQWIFGHLHVDEALDDKHRAIYTDIIELT